MPHYRVETRATVARYYFVEAADEKGAEALSCDMECACEEDQNEETMSITVCDPPKSDLTDVRALVNNQPK